MSEKNLRIVYRYELPLCLLLPQHLMRIFFEKRCYMLKNSQATHYFMSTRLPDISAPHFPKSEPDDG